MHLGNVLFIYDTVIQLRKSSVVEENLNSCDHRVIMFNVYLTSKNTSCVPLISQNNFTKLCCNVSPALVPFLPAVGLELQLRQH